MVWYGVYSLVCYDIFYMRFVCYYYVMVYVVKDRHSATVLYVLNVICNFIRQKLVITNCIISMTSGCRRCYVAKLIETGNCSCSTSQISTR